jgi:urease accessory protein
LDHILALVASGLLALRVGGKGLWAVPLAFMVSMMLGGAAAAAGLQLPGIPWAILLSIVLFGALVARSHQLSSGLAIAVVTIFAAFHGQAHVAGMTESSNWYAYLTGLGLATCALQAAVIGIGLSLQSMQQSLGLRIAGGCLAATGIVYFVMAL